MSASRFLLPLLLLAPLLTGAEGSCRQINGDAEPEVPDPFSAEQPFQDGFSGGLVNWRLTAPIPNHQLGSGNPIPCMEVGSVSTLVTGGVSVRKFTIANGLVIEADVYWQAPSAQTTADPEVWIGLADEDDPTGVRGLAAGMWVDTNDTIHYQVNGVDIGTASAPGAGAWHRFVTTIRVDRVVEFRVDGALQLTGGSVDNFHAIRPVEAYGIGYPERPRFDNVVVRLP